MGYLFMSFVILIGYTEKAIEKCLKDRAAIQNIVIKIANHKFLHEVHNIFRSAKSNAVAWE